MVATSSELGRAPSDLESAMLEQEPAKSERQLLSFINGNPA